MVILVNRMRISVGFATSALEIFTTDQAAIDVDVRQRYRAHLLKVKVKDGAIYLVRNDEYRRKQLSTHRTCRVQVEVGSFDFRILRV